jgi:hypothetical protein
MNTRINALQANIQAAKQSPIQSQNSVETSGSLNKIAQLAAGLKAQRTGLSDNTKNPLDPVDLLMRASQNTYSGESYCQAALKKKEDLSKTTQDPAVMAALDKQIKQGEEQIQYWQDRENFWWQETKMATPPKDSPEFKLTNELREGIAKLENKVGDSLFNGSPYAEIEKHQLDLVSSHFSNGNLQQAMKFLSANPKILTDIQPLETNDFATAPNPEGLIKQSAAKSSNYKQASAVTSQKLSQTTNPKSKAQLKNQFESQKELSSFFGARSKAWTNESKRAELPINDPRVDQIDYIREYMVKAEAKFESIASNPKQSKIDVLNKKKLNSNLNEISILLGSKAGMNNNPKTLDRVMKLIKNNPL